MSGFTTCDDLQQHYAQVFKDPKYDITFNSIFQIEPDADGPILEELSKVRLLMELVAGSQKAQKKWAVVIPSGLKRAVVGFLLKNVQLKPIEMRFFGTKEEALAWLN